MKHKNHRQKASVAEILGNRKTIKIEAPSTCFNCASVLDETRKTALIALEIPYNAWTCVTCSPLTHSPRVGIFLNTSSKTDEVDTSELKICDRVYQDSVRDVFSHADGDEGEE